MKMRLICLLLAALTTASDPLVTPSQEATAPPAAVEEPAQAPVQEEPVQETPTQEPEGVANQLAVYVNGQSVPDAHSVVDADTTYVSVTHVTQALFPDVEYTWAGGDADVVYTGQGFTLRSRSGRSYIVCNDRYLYIPGGVRLHPQDGEMLVPVRVLAKALGAGLTWDDGGVYLTSGQPLESGSTFYNATDLDLLSRVVQHESGNQPLAGKIGVAQVILNRVKAGSRAGFANSVSGVIYQPGQFPGATNATPKSEAILAAKLAMDGANTVGNAKWFNGVGQACWAKTNKSLITVIGGHAFYG